MNYLYISCILLGKGDRTALSICPFQFDRQRAVGICVSQIVFNHVMKTLSRKCNTRYISYTYSIWTLVSRHRERLANQRIYIHVGLLNQKNHRTLTTIRSVLITLSYEIHFAPGCILIGVVSHLGAPSSPTSHTFPSTKILLQRKFIL